MDDRSNATSDTDIASHKIPVTFFKNAAATVMVTKELTLPELGATILAASAPTKAKLPWLKLAAFGEIRTSKGSLRHDANATGINGVEEDYDDEEISFDAGVKALKRMDVRGLVYTTPTHTIERPRWRYLLPTSKTLPIKQRKLLAARVNGWWGGDMFNAESFVLSQSYYYGKAMDNPAPDHRVEIIDGQFVDLQTAIRQYERDGMPTEKPGDKPNPFTDYGDEQFSKRGRGFETIMAELGDGPGGRGFHEVQCAAVASYVVTNRDEDCSADSQARTTLKTIMRDAINAAPKTKEDDIPRYLTDYYLDNLIDTALAKYPADNDGEDEHDASGHIILSDKNHVSRARKMRRIHRPNLQHYRDDFMDFDSGAYHVVADGVINAETWTFLDKAKAKRRDGRGKDAVLEIVPFQPNQKSVSETIAALKAVAHLNPKLEPPCWLNSQSDLPASVLIAFPNGLLDLRDKTLHPLDANFFTTAALGFDYVAHAPKPIRWLKFLDEIFAGDDKDEQIAAIQEMFGYMMIPDTSLEKAFLLIGPKRSGKGTILAMLRKLLGTGSTAGPSLKSLSTNFGLAPLIGKQLAIIDDLRVGAPKDQDVLIENILKITGRGFFTIDRKFKSAWEGMLLLKLLLVSNLLPKLGDDSAALASRFISFETRVSFYGRENPTLFEAKLVPELAGIFHWALDGLQRLRERRHFKETTVSKDARERLANLGSLTRAFINERCVLQVKDAEGKDVYVEKRELYDKWVEYAKEN